MSFLKKLFGKSSKIPPCDRCGSKLKEVSLGENVVVTGMKMPTLYNGVVCNACGKIECVDCKRQHGQEMNAPCSWCNGEVSPGYETAF